MKLVKPQKVTCLDPVKGFVGVLSPLLPLVSVHWGPIGAVTLQREESWDMEAQSLGG